MGVIKIIKFKGVNKWFGDLHVLKDINLEIKKGEVVVIIGASGSGKSTMLRCINCLENFQEGEVIVDDIKLNNETNKMEVRKEVGMVFQQFNLFPHKNVLENIIIGPVHSRKISRGKAEERAVKLLEKVGISEKIDSYPSSLSGGQKQRVAIARALAMQPKVMLFDEPTSALDPEMIKDVLNVMRDLANEGMTMAVVTHELGFAREVANRIVFIDEGRIVEINKSEEFFANPVEKRSKEFLSQIL
ncbi:MAG: amino acid ABC transporter ATP-binding protein [Bacillota bacterium]